MVLQERRLNMYVKYCQNKPISEYIVHKHKQHYFFEIQSEIGTKLDIADYLIKPVQRIMKYQLLLKASGQTEYILLHININIYPFNQCIVVLIFTFVTEGFFEIHRAS